MLCIWFDQLHRLVHCFWLCLINFSTFARLKNAGWRSCWHTCTCLCSDGCLICNRLHVPLAFSLCKTCDLCLQKAQELWCKPEQQWQQPCSATRVAVQHRDIPYPNTMESSSASLLHARYVHAHLQAKLLTVCIVHSCVKAWSEGLGPKT